MKKITLILMVALLFFSTNVFAGDRIFTKVFSDKAVSGYDPVAYFIEGKPVKGDTQFKFIYMDADWYFSSLENLEKFKSHPDKYAPQYGGYCAWAVAQGNTAAGNPMNWTIHNGKLYLNYNDDIQEKWLKDIDELIRKGDQNWPEVVE
jgi:YHS domain-containing protein